MKRKSIKDKKVQRDVEVQEYLDELAVNNGLESMEDIKLLQSLRDFVTKVKQDGSPQDTAEKVINHIRDIRNHRLEYERILIEAKDNKRLRKLSLRKIADYFRNYLGEVQLGNGYKHQPWLYGLITLCQNFSMNKVIIRSPYKMTGGNFHQLHLGSAQAGKSFSTYDLLVGSERKGLPPHGIPFIYKFGNVSPASFPLDLYCVESSNNGYIYANDETSTWLKSSSGIINQLKLALEGKEISWQVKRGFGVPPFKVEGNFIMCANERYNGEDELESSNPDYEAVMSRCITKGWFLNDKIASWMITRRTLEKINKRTSQDIRQLMVLLHSLTRQNTIEVIVSDKQYEELVKVREDYIQRMRIRQGISNRDVLVNTATREIESAMKIAGNLAIMNRLRNGHKSRISVGVMEMKIAKMLLLDILKSRETRLEPQSTSSYLSDKLVAGRLQEDISSNPEEMQDAHT